MSWRIRIRDREECTDQPFLLPDLIIKPADYGVFLDFALAEPDETRNKGGLRSKEALHTAILIQLFSDARMRDDDLPLDELDPDRKGWWGDSVARVAEQGDHNIGSRLWTLRRSILNDETATRAREIVAEALQPIADQGAVVRFEIETEANYGRVGRGGPETGVLLIGIRGYSQDGSLIYDQRFDVLWDQIKRLRS